MIYSTGYETAGTATFPAVGKPKNFKRLMEASRAILEEHSPGNVFVVHLMSLSAPHACCVSAEPRSFIIMSRLVSIRGNYLPTKSTRGRKVAPYISARHIVWRTGPF